MKKRIVILIVSMVLIIAACVCALAACEFKVGNSDDTTVDENNANIEIISGNEDNYETYGVLGKTIDLINASQLETVSGGKSVFNDDLYNWDIYKEALGQQEATMSSYDNIESTISDTSISVGAKISVGATGRGFLSKLIPSFSVSASGTYERVKKSETNEYGYTYNYTMNGYRVDIKGYKDIEDLTPILSDDLIADAVKVRNGSLKPAQFVERWGTHVIMSAIYGEKVDVVYTCIMHSGEESTEWINYVNTQLSASFSKVGVGISADYAKGDISTAATSSIMQNLSIKVTSQMPLSATNLAEFASAYSAWETQRQGGISNGKDYSVFCDVPDNSLYCVWYLLGSEYQDVIDIMDNYMFEQCSDLYKEKISAINSYKLSDDVEFDSDTQCLTFNLNYYQETGNLFYNSKNGEIEFNGVPFGGVYDLSPYYNGTPIKKIVINGSYKTKNDSGQIINQIIIGFAIKFDKDFDDDLEIVLNNVAFASENATPLDFSSVTKNISVTILYNGTNVIGGGKGTLDTVIDAVNISLSIVKATDDSSLDFGNVVTFNLNDTLIKTTPAISSTSVVVLKNDDARLVVPNAEYYVFDGWYTEADGGTQLTDTSGNPVDGNVSDYIENGKWVMTGGKTVYAHWSQVYLNYTYIASIADLEVIRAKASDSYMLVCDIDMQSSVFVPFGEFSGVFDGDGHSISNIIINMETHYYATLFYCSIGTIKNLTIDNATIYALQNNINELYAYASGIVGDNKGTISNCTVQNSEIIADSTNLSYNFKVKYGVDSKTLEQGGNYWKEWIGQPYENTGGDACYMAYAGGICVKNYGIIDNCQSLNNDIQANTYYNRGSENGEYRQYSYAGGICACAYAGGSSEITFCKNTSTVVAYVDIFNKGGELGWAKDIYPAAMIYSGGTYAQCESGTVKTGCTTTNTIYSEYRNFGGTYYFLVGNKDYAEGNRAKDNNIIVRVLTE